jgi:hypothetical protein
MSRFIAAGLALCAAFGAGCASHRVHLEADGGDGRLAPGARYSLETGGRAEASIVVEAEGAREIELEGRETDTARFRVTVYNGGESAVQIPLDRLAVRDDRGQALHRAGLFAGPGLEGNVFVTPGGATNSFELLYDLGAPERWDVTGSVAVDWGYDYRGTAKGHQTRFLPVRYVTRVYREPVFFGFGFGFGHGYRHRCR